MYSRICEQEKTILIITDYRNGQYQYYNHLNFRGELETRFFKAVKNKNIPEQLKILNNIKFDILETDKETGNNFFHIVCQNGNKDFLDKCKNKNRSRKNKKKLYKKYGK